ncbi:MAG: hypothetical protein KAI70_00530 [Candidatus Omnitrophica bacterium]|nr:hypothetical protein [Candidatus Omnitrophota bacterium]
MYSPFESGITYHGDSANDPMIENFSYVGEPISIETMKPMWRITKGNMRLKSNCPSGGFAEINETMRVVWSGKAYYKTCISVSFTKKDMKMINDYEGFHIMFRYQNSDNLYVASIRNDQRIVVKKKVNGIYKTLFEVGFVHVVNEIINASLQIDEGYLDLVVNGVCCTVDFPGNELPYGSIGFRGDNLTAEIHKVSAGILK